MKKLIAFDFDKTLYDHQTLSIPESAERALRALREREHIIVLATGRDMSTHYSRPYLDLVNAAARVEQNGAKVVVGDKVLFEHYIDRGLLKRMMDYAERTGIGFGVTIENEDYYLNPERIREAEMKRWGQCGRQFKDARALLARDIRTVNFIGTEEEAKAMEQAFPELQLRMFSVNYGADIIEKGISKAEGLKKLCAYYGLEMSDVYAFGDSYNDSEMLEEAGVGIAMGNAKEALKEIADYITSPIDQDGIWNACRHFQLV